MDISIPKMSYTGDFQALSISNPHMFSGTSGGISGTKRMQEVDVDRIGTDNSDGFNMDKKNSPMVEKIGDGEESYGSSILSNFLSHEKPQETTQPPASSDGIDYIRFDPATSENALPRTAAVLPSDLTTNDRMAAAPEFEVGGISNPNTLGDSLSELVQKVHDKTVEYEHDSNKLLDKHKGSAYDQTKNSFYSDYVSLSGVEKPENTKSDIERQMENFVEVMNGSYEYYIYSSLLVDSGKSVSQTAQTLTKG